MAIELYLKSGAGEDAVLCSTFAFASGIPGEGHSQFSYEVWVQARINLIAPDYAYGNVGLQAVAPNDWSPDCKLWAGLATAYREPIKPPADTTPPTLDGVTMVDLFTNRMVIGPLAYNTPNAFFGKYLVLVAEIADVGGSVLTFSSENIQLSYGGH